MKEVTAKNCTLVEMDDKLFKKIEQQWSDYFANDDEQNFSEAYLNMLSTANLWLRGESKTTPDSQWRFYVLVDESGDCHALIHVSHVLPNSPKTYFKLMSIRTNPEYDSRNCFVDENELERINVLWGILIELVLSCVALLLTSKYNLKQVKVLGNNQMDMAFFSTLLKILKGDNTVSTKVLFSFTTLKTYRGWLDMERK